jgi:hypothetical protein
MWSGLLFAALVACGGDAPKELKQESARYQATVTVYEGNPQGSVEAGTLRIFQCPAFVVMSRRPFTYADKGLPAITAKNPAWSLGECASPLFNHSHVMKGIPGPSRDGEVYLDIKLECSQLAQNTDQHAQIETRGTHTVGWFGLGVPVKVRWPQMEGKDQVWAEIVVMELDIKDGTFVPMKR